VGVLARAPAFGRCKPELLAAHGAPWVDGLYAAMLRDTLDGLQSLDATEFVIFAGPGGRDVLARHAPAPWRIVVHDEPEPQDDDGQHAARRIEHALATLLDGGGRAVLAASDAPSCPTEPLAEALARGDDRGAIVLLPSEDGGIVALATDRLEPRLFRGAPFGTPALVETLRVRCNDLGLEMRRLPTWYDVDRPSDVLRLQDELRRHPERAPRTAQFLVTAG
jgi:glycosyltransferase A (GT-A) superfamily protein (DUF2064 family)